MMSYNNAINSINVMAAMFEHSATRSKHGGASMTAILSQKHCPKCGKDKDRSEFPRNRKAKNGLYSWCKLCCNKKTADAYRTDPTYLIEYGKARHARLMNEDPEYSEKHSADSKQWRDANPEKQKINLLRGVAIRKEREQAAEGSYTKEEWKNLQDEYLGHCVYCGAKVKLEKDHIVSISRGGTNYIDNIVPACRSCNQSKKNSPLLFWMWRKLNNPKVEVCHA